MGGERGRPDGQDLQLQRRDAVEEALTHPQGDRCDVGAELVDQAGGEILVDRGGATGDGDVAITRRRACLVEGAWMPSVTKVKVVPPCIVSGSRGWWVSTTTGAW
jgi:hypothetical protein